MRDRQRGCGNDADNGVLGLVLRGGSAGGDDAGRRGRGHCWSTQRQAEWKNCGARLEEFLAPLTANVALHFPQHGVLETWFA